ncbi:cyclin-A1-4-like [Primulina tabacum]|uniref:cyclin-A1-4-like n=1 Tax=Primulina tabacum TaxID=48773 RepID=UPI003F5A6EB4
MDQDQILGTMERFDSLLISEQSTRKSLYDSKVIVDMDENADPLLSCSDLAPEIFKNLRALESMKRRPPRSTQVDEKRGYYVEWFVDTVDALEFSKETLYHMVQYFDSWTMGKSADKRETELLCVACFILASKYEEVWCPSMRIFSRKYKFSCRQIVDMEKSVLKSLGYQLSNPTTWSFMERFMQAAQGGVELRCMASYIAELSLYSYNINIYLPSVVAASSVFLAKYILHPSQMPWNPSLQHCTLYEPSDLRGCVMELHDIAIGKTYNFPGISRKYRWLLYCRVASKAVPPSIPAEYFNSI